MRLSSYGRMDFLGGCWEIDMVLGTTRLDWQCVTEGESAILGIESLGNNGG